MTPMNEPFALYPSKAPPAKDGAPNVQSWGFACPSADMWARESTVTPDSGELSDVSGQPMLLDSTYERGTKPHMLISLRPMFISGRPTLESLSTREEPAVQDAAPPAEHLESAAPTHSESLTSAPEEMRAASSKSPDEAEAPAPLPPTASAPPTASKSLAPTSSAPSTAEHDVPLLAALPIAAPPAPARAAAAPVSTAKSRFVVLPIVCILAAAAGLALGTRMDLSRQAAPVANLTGEVSALRSEQGETRAQIGKQAAALAETRETLHAVTQRQERSEDAAKAEQARAEAEEARLTRDVAATKRAQARTDEHVYQLSEALKLIDWATTGGYATTATADMAGPAPRPLKP